MRKEIEMNEKIYSQSFRENGKHRFLVVRMRFDDRCGNGYQTFAITGEVYASKGHWSQGCDFIRGGAIHDEIAVRYNALNLAIKWHLCSENGPLHYIANSQFWAKKGHLENFRKSAIWPGASEKDMEEAKRDSGVLLQRLPSLMQEFWDMLKTFELA